MGTSINSQFIFKNLTPTLSKGEGGGGNRIYRIPLIREDTYFKALNIENKVEIPLLFEIVANNEPHPLCVIAAEDLQHYLLHQNEWKHNFGLSAIDNGKVIGKMFGVLVVQNAEGVLGYLAAFSGKLAGANKHTRFVPPIFDGLTDGSFLNIGMQELTRINAEIAILKEQKLGDSEAQIKTLKLQRKQHSVALQAEIYDHYSILNKNGDYKSLVELYKVANYKNPPSGAAECAGPKLLQYAFLHGMQPIAMAEFWWGLSPKSATWIHKQYYACCEEKCAPLLRHMLVGIND